MAQTPAFTPAAAVTAPDGAVHSQPHASAQLFDAPAQSAAPEPRTVYQAPVEAPAPTAAPASVSTHAQPNIETTRVSTAPVDQIDDDASIRSTPRPARRRNRDVAPSEPLVFIETVPELAVAVVPVEDEAPRRRTPRPRGSRPVTSEPLQFVETKHPVAGDGNSNNAA